LLSFPLLHRLQFCAIKKTQKRIVMKHLLQMEQLAQLAIAVTVLFFIPQPFNWWQCVLIFFAPDLGMIGYVINTRLGAWTYNLTHHKLVCVAIILTGLFLGIDWLLATGILFYGHSAFDRLMGYGLKYEDAFGHTHLGFIGKPASQQ